MIAQLRLVLTRVDHLHRVLVHQLPLGAVERGIEQLALLRAHLSLEFVERLALLHAHLSEWSARATIGARDLLVDERLQQALLATPPIERREQLLVLVILRLHACRSVSELAHDIDRRVGLALPGVELRRVVLPSKLVPRAGRLCDTQAVTE